MFRKNNAANHMAIIVTPTIIIFKSQHKTAYHPANGIFANELIIGNLSRFINIIKSFIRANNLIFPKTVFALDGPAIAEKLDINAKLADKYLWQKIILSHQKDRPLYYCGINKALTLQYTLLAHRCSVDLVVLTSCTAVQLIAQQKIVLAKNLTELKNELQTIDRAEATLKIASSF